MLQKHPVAGSISLMPSWSPCEPLNLLWKYHSDINTGPSVEASILYFSDMQQIMTEPRGTAAEHKMFTITKLL
jgi:hypothetical protein